MARQKPLGRGLSALFDESSRQYARQDSESGGPIVGNGPPQAVQITALKAGSTQPRRTFDHESLSELAESIKIHGVLQPLIVRPVEGQRETYEIIAGERRWRAAQMAQLHEVPVIVRALSDEQSLEIGLIENLQRKDLSPLEEAEGLRRLMDDFAHTQDDVARIVGKSRSHVANTLRLLRLAPPVAEALRHGRITAGHARALLAATDGEQAQALLEEVLSRGLSVRQTEALIQRALAPTPEAEGPAAGRITDDLDYPDSRTEVTGRDGRGHRRSGSAGSAPTPGAAGSGKTPRSSQAQALAKDPEVIAMEAELMRHLGLRVELIPRGEHGSLVLHYRDLEQLDDLLTRLGGM